LKALRRVVNAVEEAPETSDEIDDGGGTGTKRRDDLAEDAVGGNDVEEDGVEEGGNGRCVERLLYSLADVFDEVEVDKVGDDKTGGREVVGKFGGGYEAGFR
jgi:hypothetical protein